MRTSKSFEIVSYNTLPFLENKISEMKKAKIFEFAFWIRHKPDTDEKKEHNHIYVIPAKMIQTMDITEEFKEPDWTKEHPEEMPLGARIERTSNYDFKNSKWDDALLYSIHDKIYLRNKGLTRNIHYEWKDLKSTDEDFLQALINRIEPWADKPVEKMIKAIQDGETSDLAILKAAGISFDEVSKAMAWVRVIREENSKYLPERGTKHSHSERVVCCRICGEIKSIREFPYLSITTDIEGNDHGDCFACLWRNEQKRK